VAVYFRARSGGRFARLADMGLHRATAVLDHVDTQVEIIRPYLGQTPVAVAASTGGGGSANSQYQ
jgi:hypothetical protein